MNGWVTALEAHRQRLIRQARDGQDPAAAAPSTANMRRGSIGMAAIAAMASTPSTLSSSFGSLFHRRGVHTLAPAQSRHLESGHCAATELGKSQPSATASAAAAQEPAQPPYPVSRSQSFSVVSRELSGLSLQSGSNRRSLLSTAQTVLAMDDAAEAMGEAGLSQDESKRLILKVAELERDLDERDEMIRELKEAIQKDLQALSEKHRQRTEEMVQLRRDLAFAHQKLGELAGTAQPELGRAPMEDASEGDSDSTQKESKEEDKDAIISDQKRQIEELKAQLEGRPAEREREEEALMESMQEKVRLTIEMLKKEQEHEIRKLSQLKVSSADTATNEQLRTENALLREEIKKVLEKMNAFTGNVSNKVGSIC